MGTKAQDHRIGLAPEPEILMEAIEEQDDKRQDEWNLLFQFRSTLKSPNPAGSGITRERGRPARIRKPLIVASGWQRGRAESMAEEKLGVRGRRLTCRNPGSFW